MATRTAHAEIAAILKRAFLSFAIILSILSVKTVTSQMQDYSQFYSPELGGPGGNGLPRLQPVPRLPNEPTEVLPTRFPGRWSEYHEDLRVKDPVVVCRLRYDKGLCRDVIRKYAFDIRTNRCIPFLWTGCGGNQNRFETIEECEKLCKDDE